jgi:hypothetical protein
VNVSCQDNITTLGFSKGNVQEMTTSSFLTHTPLEKHLSLEVSDYHLIFNLIGVLVATSEDQT